MRRVFRDVGGGTAVLAAEALGCERKEDCLVLREAIEDPRERLDRTAGLLAAVAERAEEMEPAQAA